MCIVLLLQTLTNRTKVSLKARVAFLVGKVWTERHAEHVPMGRDDIISRNLFCVCILFSTKQGPLFRVWVYLREQTDFYFKLMLFF